jgi:hypothetical protein
MPLKLNSSGGGSVTLDTPSTASTYTLTVPAITGTAVVTGSTATVSQGMLASGVAGNGPAFSAYRNTGQTLTANVATKLLFNLEEFDTANNFDTSLSRFTPNVAGYYQVSGAVQNSVTASGILLAIFKNGSNAKIGQYTQAVQFTINTVSALIYLNGTTDYIELYATFSATGDNTGNSYFQAVLVRAA